jgi:cell division transport system permease protein
MRGYLRHHGRALFHSLGRMARAPFATALTVAVIGVSLALPGVLYALLANLEQLGAGGDRAVQLSLFLRTATSERQAHALAADLRNEPGLARVDYIAREQALEEFKQFSGLGEALRALDGNPFPAVLVLQPAPAASDPDALAALARRLERRPEVEFVQFDLDWVQRLQALRALAERALYLLAALLALGVLLVVAQASRAAVHGRRNEIEVIELVGATAAFVRRPFLYSGALHGLAGAALAWVLVAVATALLAGPVGELARLYGTDFELQGLSVAGGLALLGLGAALGWIGARLALIGRLSRPQTG